MRQIEDRWRINIRDPPNPSETIMNIINNFSYSSSQVQDVHNYKNFKFRNYIANKCSKICLDKSNFNDCLNNCAYNLEMSKKSFENSLDRFEEKYSAYELAGKDYFKS